MFFVILYIFLLKSINLSESANNAKFNISAICGYPGEPISSQHNVEDKGIFKEGETVSYQCVDFLGYKQDRRCHSGEWVGPQARCGYGIDNDLKRVVVKDCTTDETIADFNRLVLHKNSDRFTNSFSTDRYNEEPIRVSNSTCYRWHLHLTDRSNLSFVRIDFATVFESVGKSNKDVPIVKAFVGKYINQNMCRIETMKKYKHIWTNKWITYSNKYHYYFNCHLNNTNESVPDISKILIIETDSETALTIDLVRFAIAEVYGGVEDPACGIPEIPVGVNANIIKEYQLYELYCDEPYFVNASSPSNTLIKCSSNALWSGYYPKCKPRKSCDNSETLKSNENSLITSIENVYQYNQTFWYAIDGTVINYDCDYYTSDSMKIKSKKCLSTGLWKIMEPMCPHNDYKFYTTLASTAKDSVQFLHLLPFYIMAAITSLVVIIIAVIALVLVINRKKREEYKEEYKDPNDCKPSKHECIESQYEPRLPMSCVTENSFLEESESLFQFQYQYHTEPVYDVPPRHSKSVRISPDNRKLKDNTDSEPIYDEPKRRDHNSNN